MNLRLIILFLLISSNLYSLETDWKLMGQPSDGYVRSLDCRHSNDCFIITAGSNLTEILTSSNKAKTWKLQYRRDSKVYDPPYVNNTRGGVSPSPSHFVMYFSSLGEIHKSKDSGRTFERITLYDGRSTLYGIAMRDSNVGIAINYYNIYVTFDGWKTFEVRDTSHYNTFQHIEFISDSIVRGLSYIQNAVMNTGPSIINYNIYTDEFEELYQFQPKKEQIYRDFYEFMDIASDSVSYVSGRRLLGLGDQQVDLIAKTTDGGRTWKNVLDKEYDPRFGLLGISFYDENNGVASGRSGKILMTNDGGQTWKYEVPKEIFGQYDKGLGLFSTSIDWAGRTPIIGSTRGYIYRYEGDYFVFDGKYKGSLSISGRVTDNGLGVEGISIFNGEVYASTDSEGYYKFPHLEAGKYRIAPEDPDYNFEVSEIIVQLDESRENVDFETTKRDRFFRFSGRVTINGEGVDNAVIDADYYTAFTDSNGYYEIPKMHKSDIDEPYIGAYYTVSARNNKYTFLPKERILVLVSDTAGFDFYLNSITSVEIAEHKPIYPNPTSDYINIDDSHNFDRVEVYDIRANLVMIESEDLHRIDIRELSSGTYFMYLYKRGTGVEVVKFVKRK